MNIPTVKDSTEEVSYVSLDVYNWLSFLTLFGLNRVDNVYLSSVDAFTLIILMIVNNLILSKHTNFTIIRKSLTYVLSIIIWMNVFDDNIIKFLIPFSTIIYLVLLVLILLRNKEIYDNRVSVIVIVLFIMSNISLFTY